MKRVLTKLLAGLLPAVCMLAAPGAWASGPVKVLTNLVVSSDALPNLPGWSLGGKRLSVQPTTPPVSGDAPYALEGQYPAVGASGMGGAWANFSVASQKLESIYIDFWAKMPNGIGGLKFCKVFGDVNDPAGYANATFGPMWGTGRDQGSFLGVAFGDGSTTINDDENGIRFTGGSALIGRSYGTAIVLTPQMTNWWSSNWGTTWHHFRIYIKFNDGTTSADEVPDGALYEEIDGKVYIDATGLYNRNPQNGPINRIGFFGWAQSDAQPFDVWYDNIVISTGGWATGLQATPVQRPAPMTSVTVQ